MRCLSAAQIKKRRKGLEPKELQEKPRQGSRVRQLYDQLMASKGVPVVLDLRKDAAKKRQDYCAIQSLINFYGLDIRIVQHGYRDTPTLHVLAGEWFGPIYRDYIAEHLEGKEAAVEIKLDDATFSRVVTQPLARALVALPEGVHFLSSESEAALARAHAKCAEAEAKFVKRGA